MARTTPVAIVGLGSRGLSVLERIVTHAKRAGPAAGGFRVHLIDPTGAGAGVHGTGQPDYLLLNTTCAQVSMFPDEHTVGDERDEPGPNLYDWATARGLRIAGDGFTVGPSGRAIRPHDFLPRRVLGEYLGWFLGELRRRAPSHVDLVFHRAEAVDVTGDLRVVLSDGSAVDVDFVYLTTGYTPNGPADPALPGHERFLPGPYPLPDRLDPVAPGESVAVAGFGLSAIDVVSAATIGRGGRFTGGAYEPSGREPVIYLYSRSGVPCRARPLVVEFGPPYRPLVFTPEAIDGLRADRGGPLDFDRDVLPLVHTEMHIAFRRCQARLAGGDAAVADLERAFVTDGVPTVLARAGNPFDPSGNFLGTGGLLLDDSGAYAKWFAEVLRRDLDEGLLGFAGSPVKAGLDIVRALRDTFRYVVDFGGLTDESLDEFNRTTVPLMNRAVVGPQYERHAELLALMAAGVVHVPFGPAPRVEWSVDSGKWTVSSTQLAVPYAAEVDWLLNGHMPGPSVAASASPLVTALYRAGRLRPHRPESLVVHGVDVDRDLHPFDAQGLPERRIWVLGPLIEGATFYTNLVPSPGAFSRPFHDAHRIVVAMREAVDASAPVVVR